MKIEKIAEPILKTIMRKYIIFKKVRTKKMLMILCKW